MNQNYNNVLSQLKTSQFAPNKKLELSAQAFQKWRQYIYDKCGIYFQDNKKYLLESRLQKRINYLGLESFEKYFDYVNTNSRGEDEKKYLYEAITINETFFFRNQPQLDSLVSSLFPEIIAAKKRTGKRKIRIWSAASSSGEEAYSIAMVWNDLMKPRAPGIDLEIVGTDINYAVIETARQGIYKEYSIRNTPQYYLKKYFKPVGKGYEIDQSIKNIVSFKLLNLHDDAQMRMMNNFDIIFCANVLIYFDLKSKIKVVSHLYNGLNPGGYLFIGYSETLHGISKAFKLVSFPKTITYKKG